jgi:isochorismate synthase
MSSALPEKIHKYLTNAFLYKKGVAFYRLPGKDQITFICGEILPDEGFPDGFFISPFSTGSKPAIVISPDIEMTLNLSDIQPEAHEWYSSCFPGETGENYPKIVEKGLEKIKTGELQKVVIARKKVDLLPEDFNHLRFLLQLAAVYPEAFVSLTSTPNYGTWIGASPEVLLRSQNGKLDTMALAGTRNLNGENSFEEKEVSEQQLVTSFISSCFKSLKIDFTMKETQTVKAGNLVHLVNYFSSPETVKWKQLLPELHPTPAVCGIPREEAMRFIIENENFDRELFAGFLGSVKDEDINFFVNLRCMQVCGEKAVFYAGAGIVEGSDPEKEFRETEEKMNTLRNVLYG